MRKRRLREFLHRAVVKARSDGVGRTLARAPSFVGAVALNGAVRLATDDDDFLDARDIAGRDDTAVVATFDDAESLTFAPPRGRADNPFFAEASVDLRFDASFVATVDGVTIAGGDAVKLTDDGRVLVEDSKQFRGIDRFYTSMYREVRDEGFVASLPVASKVATGRTWRPPRRSFDTVFPLVGFPLSFYHWVVEFLPRLRALARYTERTGDSPTVLVPTDSAGYVADTLELLGCPVAEWTPWEPGWTRVETLVYPSHVRNGDGVPHPASCRWLRDRVHEATGEPDGETPARIYVDRTDARERRVANRRELDELLAAYDFEPVVLSERSIERQVELFRNADCVVGPHGAGLVHLVFGDDLAVVELFGDELRDHYYALSTIAGHEYYCVQGTDGDGVDISVDIDELRAVLESIG